MSATEFFKRPGTRKWVPFILTYVSYLCMEVAQQVSTWVIALDQKLKWDEVSWQQKWVFWTLLVGGVGKTFIALKSRAWADATKKPEVE